MSAAPVVFVHGMYMTSLCWEHWVRRFQAAGRTCMAPNWPGRDSSIDELRNRHPDRLLGELGLTDVVAHFTKVISAIPQKPVLVGHSMGGLVVQMLLQADLACAGVAIDSAPPAGIFVASWPFLKSNWPHVTPFKPLDRPVEMTFPRFQYTFVNSLPQDEQRAAYSRYVVPESRRVPRQSLGARIDFRKPRAPLLLIGGSSDHIIPARLNRRNHARYRRNTSSITDYREFAGRTHFIIGQKGWEQVADEVLGWIQARAV